MTTYTAPGVREGDYGLPGITVKIMFSMIFVVLMAISANTYIYLPFTPVPVTLQVLTVMFSAFMLGGTWAAVSQLMYIIMGVGGLPVFAGFSAGPGVLMGPTGGYIIGFALAAYISGSIASGRFFRRPLRTPESGYILSLAAGLTGLVVIYALGGLHLFGFLSSLSPGGNTASTMKSAWEMGIRPFIILDLAKILAAMIILKPKITGNEDYKNK